MPVVDTSALISVQDANKRGISRLVRDAEEGDEKVVLRNNKPVAAVVSIEHLERIEEREAWILDVSLAVARELTTSPNRHSLDDVLDMFGYTREDLSEGDDSVA
ncbi:MAG: type II toxin-antitoxin system Phd/YefM family antitoxin [Solirubrobacteraceae bacterium]